ncbi:hypothetical protein M9H77_03698 [Catharanthus roseus]|uniref:Uncharacterized protein n=1 Tax=Catharanthus roseus TaxID=4058 RepID=A0ACC0CC50_CATRO|nr:hypothetical protein M9H77_03698 [Catharanthus roseus]
MFFFFFSLIINLNNPSLVFFYLNNNDFVSLFQTHFEDLVHFSTFDRDGTWSKKKRAHPETSTLTLASILPGTVTSTPASIPPSTSASPATACILPVTLTLFPYFNKQSACENSITEIIKEHFVVAPLRCFQEKAEGGIEELSVEASWPGAQRGESRSFIEWVKYHELKANTERLHTETGSPKSTDEQLMFEAISGNNKGHVYAFGS